MPRSPARRTALLALAALVAALLSVLVPEGPAQASASCTQENGIPLVSACDDERAPVTGAASFQVNGSTISVSATADHTDSDPDPIGFQCQLDGTGTWGGCTFTGVGNGGHTVGIRAVDLADVAITPLCRSPFDCPLTGFAEVADVDATPTVVNVAVGGGGPPPPGPGGAPETQISGGPSDRLSPGSPVALTRRPTVVLASSEPAAYNCAINAKKVRCHDGVNVLKGLKPGTQIFVAQAVARDGRFDATPASFTFYVPIDLKAGRDWNRVRSKGSFGGDYLTTARRGAVLNVGRVKGVREVRLLAPTGPRLGKVGVRVGHGKWKKVDLRTPKARKLRVFVVRAPGSEARSGRIQIKAFKVPAGGAVAVDALVAR
jgi:hypothetical protein